ncbi:SidA/IucD/PvdA family monooxygenase [Micromonospora sp. CPCC 205711]|uniref:lysine N(6)-hydroxylase/L-ornithine N(5)-oxygenase family protein n=1 Tax=Micromonospora sp. CPCC 205547 TaxID=3122400 RepID=UPI002FEF2C8E
MSTHDVIGIGLGPYNLGLACLTAPLPELDALFLEARPEFSWHPGMLLESTRLQTPFLADLVTLADPGSPYSFLRYLKERGRLYPFYIRESFFPLRAEYDDYCRWAAARLDNLRFGHRVTAVGWDEAAGHYLVHATVGGERVTHRARHLVLGTGLPPYVPDACAGLAGDTVVHTSAYREHRAAVRGRRRVTVVGSGQSAAEVVRDLLTDGDPARELSWVTRSPRFFPLEYTKLTLELTSPDYVDHFHALPEPARYRLEGEQAPLYKGIDADLVNEIHDLLYARSVGGPVRARLLAGTELTGVTPAGDGSYALRLRHREQGREHTLATDALVLGTGYRWRRPDWLAGVADRIRWDAHGRFDVARNYSVDHTGRGVFVQNAGTHTHSVTSPDLGMGAYRNSWIIRELLGREVYPIETRIAFQEFGVPAGAGR